MGVKDKVHPLYTAAQPGWELGRDSMQGEKAIKAARDTYLPPTSGMREDGFGKGGEKAGELDYRAYLLRAYYPEVFSDAVESAIGVMHRKPANIELTPKLERLLEAATDNGEDLQMVLRRINTQQLTEGRVGILGDIRIDANTLPQPVIVLYNALTAFNWDDNVRDEDNSTLRMVMLDESRFELQPDFEWKWEERVRVLALIDPATNMIAEFDEFGELPANVVYGYAELKKDDEIVGTEFTPISAQGVTSSQIPFAFVNAQDLASAPGKAPLDGLARLALAIYRGEADYRQNLFMQGQDTLVLKGVVADDEDESVRTGAGARIDVGPNGDAKYIGANGKGLNEQRTALENDYKRAETKSAKLVNNTTAKESGEALKIRIAAQTATLPQIAKTGAAGLQDVLRTLAEMLGEDPTKVVVTPNLEFADAAGDAQTLLQIVQSKMQGAPISDQSIHEWMVENKFTSKTYEEELAELSGEEPRL